MYAITVQPAEFFFGLAAYGEVQQPSDVYCNDNNWDLDWRTMKDGNAKCFTRSFAILFVIAFLVITTVLLLNIFMAFVVKGWKDTAHNAWQHFIEKAWEECKGGAL